MKNVTLKQLRYFRELARAQHFGLAAEASAVSQPALSTQIKELEESLGGTLIERGVRRAELTAFGKEMLGHAEQVLEAMEAMSRAARLSQGVFAGQIRLGMIPTIAPYFLPEVIQTLSDNFPQIDVLPFEGMTHELLSDLLRAKLDAAIVALPIAEASLTQYPLFEEEFLLARSIADKNAPVPRLGKLQEMRLMLLKEGHCLREQALSFCQMPSTRSHVIEGNSLSTIVQMVGAGIGITLLPEMAAEIEQRAAPIHLARFKGVPPKRTVGMVWRKTSAQAEDFEKVAQLLSTLR